MCVMISCTAPTRDVVVIETPTRNGRFLIHCLREQKYILNKKAFSLNLVFLLVYIRFYLKHRILLLAQQDIIGRYQFYLLFVEKICYKHICVGSFLYRVVSIPGSKLKLFCVSSSSPTGTADLYEFQPQTQFSPCFSVDSQSSPSSHPSFIPGSSSTSSLYLFLGLQRGLLPHVAKLNNLSFCLNYLSFVCSPSL